MKGLCPTPDELGGDGGDGAGGEGGDGAGGEGGDGLYPQGDPQALLEPSQPAGSTCVHQWLYTLSLFGQP